jgi:RNase H-fold protein (predicted Holliday junction resolvase)
MRIDDIRQLKTSTGRLLGVDFGDVRTGLAVSDAARYLASGLETVAPGSMTKTADAVAAAAREHRVSGIVLGLPVNMNGSEGPRADHVRAFADMLAYLLLKYCEPMPKREMERQSAALLGAVQYICENYTDRLTVGAVAKRFGYSANYFSTAFNEFMGVSFPDYLNACRMIEFNRIRRENPSIPTCKAAKMCGFGSMNTFYRARIEFASADQLPKDPREEHA